MQARPYFSYGRKWNYTYARTAKLCERLCILVPFEKDGVFMDWLNHMRVSYAVTLAVCVCVCV